MLSEAIGHDSGPDFRDCARCMLLAMTEQERERAVTALRKRWALWTPSKRRQIASEPQPLPAFIPEPGRCSTRGCPYPEMKDGRCRKCLLDLEASTSSMGGSHAYCREFGMVVEAPSGIRKRKPCKP